MNTFEQITIEGFRRLFSVSFEQGKRRSYNKARDAKRILEKNNLIDAVNVCPELKTFLNTILRLCDRDEIL